MQRARYAELSPAGGAETEISGSRDSDLGARGQQLGPAEPGGCRRTHRRPGLRAAPSPRSGCGAPGAWRARAARGQAAEGAQGSSGVVTRVPEPPSLPFLV
jgi:hypothetical protein